MTTDDDMPPDVVRRGRSGKAAAIAAAVSVPPLALHMAASPRRAFWIGVGLTIAGFVPGVVFALVTVLRRRPIA